MTENKMPDVIWTDSYPNTGPVAPYKLSNNAHKYLLAEPVEALLRQARDAMNEGSYICHDHDIRMRFYETITAIDTFLGAGK